MLKKWLCLILLFQHTNHIWAQNLVANSSFEDLNVCYEYAALCAPEAWFRIPASTPRGSGNYPKPRDGRKFDLVVMEEFSRPVSGRSFLYTWLLCPLEAGVTYRLTFFVNPARKNHFKLGACFTQNRIRLSDYLLENQSPTLTITHKNARDLNDDGWQKASIEFTAKGGEEYLTFGNFEPTAWVKGKDDKKRNQLKYLLDLVELKPVSIVTKPCPEIALRTKQLFEMDHRHTDTIALFLPETLAEPVAETTADSSFDEAPSTWSEVPIASPAPVVFTISDIGFAFAKHTLATTADSLLQQIALQIKAQNPKRVRIIGYTDNIGTEAYNLELSGRRAQTVQQWLETNAGLESSLFVSEGRGEQSPLASNDTETGRQTNRRVEIYLER